MLSQRTYHRLWRWLLLGVATLVLLRISAEVLASPRLLANDDFVQYWATGRVALSGQNPYDAERLSPHQRAAGRVDYVPGVATIAWNPPWSLAVFMPFSLLPYPYARIGWWLLSLASILVATDWIWRHYGGSEKQRWVAWLLALGFSPTLFALRVGQIGPLLLMGVVGFLHSIRKDCAFRAGLCLALLLIKPQLFVVLFVAIAAWILSKRRLAVVCGVLVALGLASAAVLIVSPSVFSRYTVALATHPPADWATPTIGGALRFLLGREHFWLQFVAPLFGVIWLSTRLRKYEGWWEWSDLVPELVLVSIVTAVYAWTYDLVLLVLPAIQAFVLLIRFGRHRQLVLLSGLYFALSGTALVLQLWVSNDFWFIWIAPIFMLWYALARRTVRKCQG